MFAPQKAAFPHAETPSWIPHVPRESLASYAKRLADSLNIREPIVIGGVSMGGMMSLEIARIAPVKRVVLIGSSRTPRAVNPLLRISERASRIAPEFLLDHGRALAPMFLGRGGHIPAPDRSLLVRMVRELPVSFIRWAAQAVLEWPGCEDPGVPVHHIHGDHDWVFAIRKVLPDVTIRRGSHVLNLSHPQEVNDFIAKCLN